MWLEFVDNIVKITRVVIAQILRFDKMFRLAFGHPNINWDEVKLFKTKYQNTVDLTVRFFFLKLELVLNCKQPR